MKVRLLIAAMCMAALPLSGLAHEAQGGMHPDMKRMQEQMEKIRAENDPVKRGQLIDEHMKAMHESMPMMRGMMRDGGGMMGGKRGVQPKQDEHDHK